MDEELKIQLSKLLNADSILPNLRLNWRRESPQHNDSPDDSNQSVPLIKSEEADDSNQLDASEADDSNQSDASEADDSNQSYASEDANDNICRHDSDDEDYSPPKKKRSKPVNYLGVSENSVKSQGMTSSDLHVRIQGDKVIQFCQEHGLIASGVTCSCGKPMRLVSKSGNDGCRWMCYVKSHGGRPNQTIRKGTWFESSKLSIGDILWMAYMWVHEYSLISIMHECDHSNSTIVGWCTCCIDFCREVVERKTEPIGGEEKSIEIFYCEINEDKQTTKQWAFCAIELDSTNSLHVTINDKTSFTLLQIFDQYVLPGTKVVANNWSIMKNLNSENFSYLTEKRSISFLDLVTNKKIDTYQMFKKMANRPSIQDEWSKFEYGPNFFEKMYRRCLKFAPDAFLAFLKDIAMIYKPCDTYCINSTETIK